MRKKGVKVWGVIAVLMVVMVNLTNRVAMLNGIKKRGVIGIIIVCLMVTPFLASVIIAQQTDMERNTMELGNELIISKIGSDYFNDYIKLLSIEYQSSNEVIENQHYLLTYTFKIPEKLFVNESIEIEIDIDGNIVREWGIPNNPDECEFPVDEARAIDIARDYGLEEGIKEWESDFHWHDVLKTYVWTVRNTLSASSVDEPYEESGIIVIIDANSGEVRGSLNWTSMESSSPKPRVICSRNQKNLAIIGTFVGIVIAALISVAIIRKRKNGQF